MSSATLQRNGTSQVPLNGIEELHALQRLISEDCRFAEAMRMSGSTKEAVQLAAKRGILVSPDALWRNRGRHGLPSWRG